MEENKQVFDVAFIYLSKTSLFIFFFSFSFEDKNETRRQTIKKNLHLNEIKIKKFGKLNLHLSQLLYVCDHN
jgi:hypothetical protein